MFFNTIIQAKPTSLISQISQLNRKNGKVFRREINFSKQLGKRFRKDIKRILQKISTRCILKKRKDLISIWSSPQLRLKTAKCFEDCGGFIFTLLHF